MRTIAAVAAWLLLTAGPTTLVHAADGGHRDEAAPMAVPGRPVLRSGLAILAASPPSAASTRGRGQPSAPPSNRSCGKRVALGAAIVGGAGLAASVAWLGAAGGSDSAKTVVRRVTVVSTLIGLAAGAITCAL